MTEQERWERVATDLAKQGMLRAMGATLDYVGDGEVHIGLKPHEGVSQQHGYLHAAAVAAIADSAAGYACLTRMPVGGTVVTAEFKINLLAPAVGERFVARAQVLRTGRTLSVSRSDVFALRDGKEKLVATLTATMVGVASS